MTKFAKFPAAAMALALTLGTASTAFAKAHDQGVADGDFPEIGTAAVVQDVIDGPGVSQLQNDGQRGGTASANGGDNRVDPVVGEGVNEPD